MACGVLTGSSSSIVSFLKSAGKIEDRESTFDTVCGCVDGCGGLRVGGCGGVRGLVGVGGPRVGGCGGSEGWWVWGV